MQCSFEGTNGIDGQVVEKSFDAGPVSADAIGLRRLRLTPASKDFSTTWPSMPFVPSKEHCISI